MPLPLNPFARAAAQSVADALGVDPSELPVTTPPRPDMGDFAVGCFSAARSLKQPPPALAARAAGAFSPGSHLAAASAAGPFVNFRADRGALYRAIFGAALGPDGPALIPPAGAGRTVVIDYSSPNVSKHLAYHHIRSTVIGHALCNLHRALGTRVVGVNHLGDWGTTHGQLIAAYKRWGAPEPLTITALNDLYVRFTREAKEQPALADEGRAWFVRLEEGDPDARAIWQRFRDVSWAEFDAVYRELGIQFEEVRGESDYLEAMQPVLDLLEQKRLTAVSEGALVVPLDDLGVPPLLLRKQDGATLYGTRDLAAAIYRWQQYQFDRSLYVVDRGQGLHFKQLFAALTRAGFEWAARCEHVPFGLVRIGGKKTGTRSGNVVLLREVLREASERSRERVREKNPDMSEETLAATAQVVGMGAVVFANLVSQREKDIDFEWEDVLSTDGDTGPYVQYAHARCSSVMARATDGDRAELTAADPAPLTGEPEWAVARALLEYADVVAKAAEQSEPHLLSRYLLDLAASFSRWYAAGNTDAAERVLSPDPATRRARLALVASTRATLREGLALLGLGAPDTM
ncbi:MAG TPA: arginine--tRNA ligase [Kofleriaceae bacterium]|nr:arginine--tRNA ligase [Kofleriaceae bacterium]